MRNEKLIAAGRAILKRLLSACTEGNHTMFKRMYADGNMELTIEQTVDGMDPEKIDHAITQTARTLEKAGTPEPPDEATYWKTRCLAAEHYISESPCDPDITSAQIVAHAAWIKTH